MSAAASRRVAVPLAAGAESLNVGVAAGILLYEALRDV
jgi:tRNA G18 (ribose-2'-O)-methylase SpoU